MIISMRTHLGILARLLKELQVKLPENTEDHIVAQKKLYFLSICGLNVRGYSFVWDLYGPFSRGLADDLREYRANSRVYDAIGDKIVLTENAKTFIARALTFTERPADADETKWLEILASVHFLAERYSRTDQAFAQKAANNDPEALREITANLMQRKPHLADVQTLISQAWDRIRPTISWSPQASPQAAA